MTLSSDVEYFRHFRDNLILSRKIVTQSVWSRFTNPIYASFIRAGYEVLEPPPESRDV